MLSIFSASNGYLISLGLVRRQMHSHPLREFGLEGT